MGQRLRANPDTGSVEIERPFYDELRQDPRSVAAGARWERLERDGGFVGRRISGITAGSVLDRVGLQENDAIVAFDGIVLDRDEQVLEAFSNLDDADTLDIDLVRNGKPHRIALSIVPPPGEPAGVGWYRGPPPTERVTIVVDRTLLARAKEEQPPGSVQWGIRRARGKRAIQLSVVAAGSPFAQLGLARGDMVTPMEPKPRRTEPTPDWLVRKLEERGRVTLLVERNGSSLELQWDLSR